MTRKHSPLANVRSLQSEHQRAPKKRAQTLFDKLWHSHCIETDADGESLLYIDRVCLHERTGSIALAELAARGQTVRQPRHVFCMMDHVVDTRPGRGDATPVPGGADFIVGLRRHAERFGLRLFDVGDEDQGIGHLVSAEQGIALPGLTVVCPDSHTCTLGALGCLAFGIGSSDVEHVLATSTLRLDKPANMRVVINGALAPHATAKDLALFLTAEHGAAGGRGMALEFSGEAVAGLDMEARQTLCNMAVEFGAATALIAPDDATIAYVAGRPCAPSPPPTAAWQALKTDAEATFEHCLRIDALAVVPHVTWGTSPAQGVPIDGRVPPPRDSADQRALDYIGLQPGTAMTTVAINAAYIGSCTNARLSDLRLAAAVLKNHRVAPGVAAVCVPGSTQVKKAAEAEGLHRVFQAAGFEWREAGCAMCFYAGGETFGPGKRVITTTNRNFEGRQGPGTRSHLASPAVVAASAIRGRIAAPTMV